MRTSSTNQKRRRGDLDRCVTDPRGEARGAEHRFGSEAPAAQVGSGTCPSTAAAAQCEAGICSVVADVAMSRRDFADGHDRVPEFIPLDRPAIVMRFIWVRVFPAGDVSETRLLLFDQAGSMLR
jgi:hypothetical protein